MSNYEAKYLTGRCANGAERDRGAQWHAVPAGGWRALCGAEPGKLSAGWGPVDPTPSEADHPVTCPRCLSKIDHPTASTAAALYPERAPKGYEVIKAESGFWRAYRGARGDANRICVGGYHKRHQAVARAWEHLRAANSRVKVHTV